MKHKDNARGFIRLFSLECLAIALSIFPLLHTHAAPHQANEKGVVQEIVESRDSAVILFGRAQNMFAVLFDDFDITLRNNDNRTIIASGRAKIGDYIRNNYDSNYRMVSFITYKIQKPYSDPGEYIAAANDSQSDTMRHRCYACFALIRLFINMPGCHDLRCGLRGHPVYRVASPGNTDADKIPFPAISG